MRKFLVAFMAPVAVFAVIGAVALVAPRNHQPQPSCPTEDSCAVDYRDGAWRITEVTP